MTIRNPAHGCSHEQENKLSDIAKESPSSSLDQFQCVTFFQHKHTL